MKRLRVDVENVEPRTLLANANPLSLSLHLAAAVAPAGDFAGVAPSRVGLTGQTAPGATVVLERPTAAGQLHVVARTTADRQGLYQFRITCAMGTTPFTAQATDASGDQATATLSVMRANQVIVWNTVALQTVRTAHVQAPDSARDYAIVQVAVYDAVNAIDRRFQSYDLEVKAPRGASPDAAAAAAAETALAGLFPNQVPILQAELAATLAAIPAGPGRRAGVALGTLVATHVLALRANDGANVKVDYVPGTAPGDWQPTPPAFAPAVDPQWGQVTPFVLTSGQQFQPPPPPAITSAQYAEEYNQVEVLGDSNSTVRTADETAAARFWSDLAGTFDPPGHWNQIADIAALATHADLENSARSLALVDLALADAGIEAWSVKYTDNTWRPVTAIRAGDAGLNSGVAADPTWTPLWATPAFPSYISGHSTFSAAAAAVLDSLYGNNFTFTDPGDPSEALAPRHFSSFDQAAAEAGMSRIWGGIHYMSDNLGGLLVGGEVGRYVAQHALLPR